ncbi:MAG: CotH kinase family protein [Flavobacteriales bacterium]|nr:CotH kinase family protein [Flavobacteriales bacterium]
MRIVLFLLLICNALNAQVVINEISANKGFWAFDGEWNENDWIELYNSSANTIDLSTYFLSDNQDNLAKWDLPELFIGPYGFVIFHCSGKDISISSGGTDYHHTNFRLSAGETVLLTDGATILDSNQIDPSIYFGISEGRSSDGENVWCLFNEPTPNGSNNLSYCYEGITPSPSLSLESGWYSGSESVSCLNDIEGAITFYTTDGNVPTTNGSVFVEAINMSSNTVVSARSFAFNQLPSKIIDRTYIFEEDNHGLAVFSIHTNPEHLWDEYTGIYVSGPNSEEDYPFFGSNFWQPWSKFSRLEYFDSNKVKRAEESLDLEIHGGWSRAEPQKSFRLDFKSKYTGRLEHPVINTKSHIESYNNVNLRNGGQHTWSDKIQDAIFSNVVSETNVHNMGYEGCIVYLNGEYWGVYGVREKIDEHYISDNFGYPADSLDLLNSWGALAGNMVEANNVYNEVMDTDVNSPDFFTLMDNRFNLDNYMDYFIIQTYIQNVDWMGISWGANNIKLWRPQSDDGKWSYVLYDTDASFGYFWGNPWDNFLYLAANPGYPNNHSEIFNKALQNETFKCEFANRYADLMNTIFIPENFSEKANAIKNNLVAAMPDHIERWQGFGNEWNGTINSVEQWQNDIDDIVNYNEERLDGARYYVDNTLGLGGYFELSLNAFPIDAGEVKINTITPEELPWSGVYFNGCSVTLTAIPDSGFSFSHWTSGLDFVFSEEESIVVNLSEEESFVAVFDKCDDILDVYISENDSSISADVSSSSEDYELQWYLNGNALSNDSVICFPLSGLYQLVVSSGNCSMTSDELFIEPTVGFTKNEGLGSIKTYPNPTNGMVNIISNPKSGRLKTVSLLNTIGELVLVVEADKNLGFSVDFSSIPKGVYLLRLDAENESSIEKLILQ